MVAIMAMAALSIDVVTLYLANAEAQRSADAAALAGARMLSITGITGDPDNSGGHWTQACFFATQVAIAVAEQNSVGGAPLTSGQVVVTFPNNSDINTCTGSTPAAFGVNPFVTVKVQRANLPTFFSRIWGQTGVSVSGSATAEVFNSSNSGSATNGPPTGIVTPVQPRCVKPWIVPNRDPGNLPNKFVADANGAIVQPGIRLNGAGPGVIGETFELIPDCSDNVTVPCDIITPPAKNPPVATATTLQYLPGQVLSSSSAVPSCSTSTLYMEAVGGCDQNTVYQCGVQSAATPNPNRIDLLENPAADTSNGVQCLINQAAGQDSLDTATYPYHIRAGGGNPLVAAGLSANSITTSSNSVVSLPIYDGNPLPGGSQPAVTIVGFLQVFINQDDGNGQVNVTVLNVTGCGDGTNPVGTAVSGTSPVPVRLITYP